jgi:integral membrane sensor domain MASE1
VLVALLILADRRQWLPLTAAGCAAVLLSLVAHGGHVATSVGLTLVFAWEASAATWLICRNIDGPFDLNRVSHAWTLALASVITPAVGGALAATLLALNGYPSIFDGWRAWWLAGMVGMVVTTPMVVAAARDRSAFGRMVRTWRALEIALVFAGAIVVGIAVFGEELNPVVRVPAYMLPFLLWPVFRFGPGVSSAMIFTVSVIGMWNAAQGQGPLAMAGASAITIVLRSQGSLAVAALSFLLLASEVAERKRVAHENELLVAELQQAMGEIKTLRGFIPICAWCHKVRDDAGFWQRIEGYLAEHTDATVSHGICPACAQKATEEIAVQHHLSQM